MTHDSYITDRSRMLGRDFRLASLKVWSIPYYLALITVHVKYAEGAKRGPVRQSGAFTFLSTVGLTCKKLTGF